MHASSRSKNKQNTGLLSSADDFKISSNSFFGSQEKTSPRVRKSILQQAGQQVMGDPAVALSNVPMSPTREKAKPPVPPLWGEKDSLSEFCDLLADANLLFVPTSADAPDSDRFQRLSSKSREGICFQPIDEEETPRIYASITK